MYPGILRTGQSVGHANLKVREILHITSGFFLKGLTQAKIIKKIGDFILASKYDHMM